LLFVNAALQINSAIGKSNFKSAQDSLDQARKARDPRQQYLAAANNYKTAYRDFERAIGSGFIHGLRRAFILDMGRTAKRDRDAARHAVVAATMAADSYELGEEPEIARDWAANASRMFDRYVDLDIQYEKGMRAMPNPDLLGGGWPPDDPDVSDVERRHERERQNLRSLER
jgi:hypothetical protein